MENNLSTQSNEMVVSVIIKPPRHSTKLSEQQKQNLKNAWIAVKEGSMSMYKAAKEYNVPKSTLWHWSQRPDIDEIVPTVGRPCFLGLSLENKLKNWILEAAQTGSNND